jgi:hypothetical protein
VGIDLKIQLVMGQGQQKSAAQPIPKPGTTFRSQYRTAPTPASDALVQQQAGSERHVTSRREQVGTRAAKPLDSTSAPPPVPDRSTSNNSMTPAVSVEGSAGAGVAANAGSLAGVRSNDSLTGRRPEENCLPVVIRFTVPKPPHGTGTPPPAPNVQLMLAHRNWEPIPMSASGEDFFAIVHLPRGQQAFKFAVNGQEVLDPNQPQTTSGTPANIIQVVEAVMSTTEDDDAIDDPNDWGQEQHVFEETKKMPPILPPHLRYTPLNTPPTQFRQDATGHFGFAGPDSFLDPENLPLPLTVTINHTYFQRRDDHSVIGASTRFRSKFTTVVYYKGIEKEDRD